MAEVFAAGDKLPARLYPLAYDLVDFLITLNRDAFVLLISDLKDGVPIEVALARRYDGLTYGMLEERWRNQVRERMAEEAAAKPPKWDPIFVP